MPSSLTFTPMTSSPGGVPDVLGLNAPWASMLLPNAVKYARGLVKPGAIDACLDARGGYIYTVRGGQPGSRAHERRGFSPMAGETDEVYPSLVPSMQNSLVVNAGWQEPPIFPAVFRPEYRWACDTGGTGRGAVAMSVETSLKGLLGEDYDPFYDPMQIESIQLPEFGVSPADVYVGETAIIAPAATGLFQPWNFSATIGAVQLVFTNNTAIAAIPVDMLVRFNSRLWISATMSIPCTHFQRVRLFPIDTAIRWAASLNTGVMNTTTINVTNNSGTAVTVSARYFEGDSLRAPMRHAHHRQ